MTLPLSILFASIKYVPLKKNTVGICEEEKRTVGFGRHKILTTKHHLA